MLIISSAIYVSQTNPGNLNINFMFQGVLKGFKKILKKTLESINS